MAWSDAARAAAAEARRRRSAKGNSVKRFGRSGAAARSALAKKVARTRNRDLPPDALGPRGQKLAKAIHHERNKMMMTSLANRRLALQNKWMDNYRKQMGSK